MIKRNWFEINENAETLGPWGSFGEMSKALGIPQSTLRSAVERGELDAKHVQQSQKTELNKASVTRKGNFAVAEIRSDKPIDTNELLELVGLDESEWKVERVLVNSWQSARKDSKKELEWVDGIISGSVSDSGQFNKVDLFQTKVWLTRKNRIAVKAVLQPLELKISPLVNFPDPSFIGEGRRRVLFLSDPHFGFVGGESIHDRGFIGSLISIAEVFGPDTIVWGGDVLDLPDFSKYPTTASMMFHTQKAINELAWVLGQFRQTTKRQIVIEGNHDERFRRLMIDKMKQAYELTPALESEPLFSVPRLLNLKELETEWVGNYPDGFVDVGNARFFHGNFSRADSGATVAAIAKTSTMNKFFGHIHRFEIVSKWVPDLEKNILVGSPGCLARPNILPGSKAHTNNGQGAFIITFVDGEVVTVDHIRPNGKGQTIVGNIVFESFDYSKNMNF